MYLLINLKKKKNKKKKLIISCYNRIISTNNLIDHHSYLSYPCHPPPPPHPHDKAGLKDMFKVVSTERYHLLLVGFLKLTNNKHSNKKQYFISHRYNETVYSTRETTSIAQIHIFL